MNQEPPLDSLTNGAPIPVAELAALAAAPRPAPADGLPERVRATERVESSIGPLARKLFAASRGVTARAGALLRSPAVREFLVASALRKVGLPVPEPLLLLRRVNGCDVLFSRWIVGARDLAAVWRDESFGPQQRRELARELGALVRRLHAAGVVHCDLHPGNVLVDPTAAPADRLWLIDFHRAHPARGSGRGNAGAAPPIGRAPFGRTRVPFAPRRDLLDLDHFFHCRATATEKLHFLAGYGGRSWPADRATRHAFLRRLAALAEASRDRFHRHHEQRCDGRGRAFAPITVPSGRGVSALPMPETLKLWIWNWHLRPVSSRGDLGELIHRGGASEVWRVQVDGCPLAVKLFDDRGGLRRLARGSRARRVWRNLFRLQMAELATPRTLLFLESTTRMRRPESLLVTEFLEEHEMLHRHLEHRGIDRSWPLLCELARALARLHDSGLTHRDLKAENLLVPPAADRIVFVDADGIRRQRRIDLPRAARDLMRLNASFPDFQRVTWRARHRFLALYRTNRQHDRPPLAELWRAVARLTAIKWQQAKNAQH